MTKLTDTNPIFGSDEIVKNILSHFSGFRFPLVKLAHAHVRVADIRKKDILFWLE